VKHVKKFKIYESPDHVNYDKPYINLSYSDRDAIPFGYSKEDDDVMIGKKNHNDIHADLSNDYGKDYGGREVLYFSGRMWVKYKVISFWDYPNDYEQLKEVLEDIEAEYYVVNKETIKFDDEWKIEVIFDGDEQIINKYLFWGDSMLDGDQRYINDSKLIPINDYKGSGKRTAEELAKAHMEVGKGGKVDGFGSDYYNGKLPSGMSQAEYRNTKTKYHMNEVVQYAQYTYNKELNPLFWNNFLFDERIREKLLTIANEFYSDAGYEAQIEDITLTGSLANFNYNKFSDLDVHVIIDYKNINNDIKLVKNNFDGYRFMWNLRHNIRIKGHDVELYIQDIAEEHKSTGLYSLKNADWITKPVYNKPDIEKEEIDLKYLTYKSGINILDEISKKEMTPEVAFKNHLYATGFKGKILKGRKMGLEKDGEFSVQNILFKKLRNGGDFEKLIDLIGRLYDKIYSQT